MLTNAALFFVSMLCFAFADKVPTCPRRARAPRVLARGARAEHAAPAPPPPRVAFAKRAWLKSVGGEGMKERRGSDGLEGSGGEGAKGREPSKASLIKISYFYLRS